MSARILQAVSRSYKTSRSVRDQSLGADDLSGMKAVFLPLWLSLAACTAPPALDDDNDPIDDDDAPFDIGKADGTGCLPSATSDDARGIVMLANDPAITEDDLDDHGLHWRTAAAIVAARPIADLAALDAVPTVGPVACRVLRERACNVFGLCEPTLALWTWNIEHFPLTGSAIDAVAQTLVAEDVEVVGFEEVDSLPAFDQLLAKLPEWEGIAGRTGFDTQVAIAYRRDRLKVISTEDLFTGDSDRFPRPPLAVTFEIEGRVGAERFTVVTVHLKAQVDAASRDRRRRAVIALDQWIAGRPAGERVIVVGDWNDDIDTARDRNVFQPLLDQPETYVALTLEVARRHEYSYIPFKRLIDHIVMTRAAAIAMPALVVEAVALDTTIPSYATTVSDHRPVRADLVSIIPR
ncbi:MAG: endonuclease/exonuclease/phosphatase family protein [Kofleriaceae bacterium]